MQQYHRRVARSATLILLGLLCSPLLAMQCASPGQDGEHASQTIINSYFTGPDDAVVQAGSQLLPIRRQRGNGELNRGDLALLLQWQGATIDSANRPGYGRVLDAPLHQEWVTVIQPGVGQVRVRGGGPDGGLLFAYRNAPASHQQGRSRWQLVRVPQFNSLSLRQDLKALPWNGYTGGVLAVDVRRQL
ncbi:MAG: hypothetical protein R3292_11060, partial [Alcanivorax sp.]|nr:hypothetical protein [Alcanivorax sp.]